MGLDTGLDLSAISVILMLMNSPDWFRQAISQPTSKHSLSVDGARIAYRSWNDKSTQPGLLFVHGYGAHSHWWDFVAPAFTQQYRVAALDLSGAGDSEHRSAYYARTFAKEIYHVARELGEQTIVVGHSFGGAMTRIAGFEYGAALGGIVLVDSAVSRHATQHQPPPAPRGRNHFYADIEQGMRRFRLRPPQPSNNLFLLEHIARHSLRETPDGFVFKLDQALFSRMPMPPPPALPDGASMLATMACPVGAIYGDLSKFFPEATRQLMSELLPTELIISIPEAHHHVFLDQPLAFIDRLQQLITRLINLKSA
jgi:pimeloyl-ACP methyl ester carboxylesterase